MLRKILTVILITSLLGLSACAYRPTVFQGNFLTDQDVNAIHRGMSRSAVLARLGKPVMINIYKDNRLVYVYTFEPNQQPMKKRQLLIYFRSNRVVNIKVFTSPGFNPNQL